MTAPKPRLRDVEARLEAFPQSVTGKPWVHPCDDVRTLTAAIRAVLAVLVTSESEWGPHVYASDVRAALSAHINLEES